MRQALHDTDSFIKFQNFVFLLYLCYGYPVTRLSGGPVSVYPVPGFSTLRGSRSSFHNPINSLDGEVDLAVAEGRGHIFIHFYENVYKTEFLSSIIRF